MRLGPLHSRRCDIRVMRRVAATLAAFGLLAAGCVHEQVAWASTSALIRRTAARPMVDCSKSVTTARTWGAGGAVRRRQPQTAIGYDARGGRNRRDAAVRDGASSPENPEE